ncbi:unnamed protein product [Adineta steineri]|uniref:DUF4590 domain-containing protein n=2 Tax=Adineta steineri TaxID=433720 RepID=A0A813V7Q1_9BILA|nr:unnamed protein product [Adineta steineri]
MVDRSVTKPLKQWLNPKIASSPFAQSRLQSVIGTIPKIQPTGESQQREQRITTHNISPRPINSSRLRSLRITSAHPLTQNNEVNDERSTQITSTRINEQDVEIESINLSIEERIACEITMSYAPIDKEPSNREEIIVMQRHSTGEISLVYRGYLTKGEKFSFKSQRRPTSSLSLAFYVEGKFISVTDACCEFKCTSVNSNVDDPKQFIFQEIQKANPCEKCRKDRADKLLSNNEKNTLLVQKNKKSFHPNNILMPLSVGDSVGKIPSDKHQQQQQTSKSKKSKPSETSTTMNSNQSESETKPSEQKSDENETNTLTIDGNTFNTQQLMQILAGMGLTSQSSKATRRPKSVENFCYILEKNLSISNDEQQMLCGLINLGFTFDDINSEESIAFLKKVMNEKVILILSKTSMENLSKPIQDEPYLYGIYIIDSSENNSFDSKFYRGSFSNMNNLCEQLKNDLLSFTYDLTNISSISADYTGMSTLTYVQALKDILLETDEKQDLKKEMINFCREEYVENIIQLEFIDEFEKNFQPSDAVEWYLRTETFLFKMMTRVFRELDPDILFKLRYFIQHLHGQLKSSVDMIVYRTVRIRKELFKKMKNNQGGLLSFNEFLLVNKNQSRITPSPINQESKLIHFEIILGANVIRHDISNGILLTVGTIFRIDKIETIDEETFKVTLTTNEDILKAGELLTKDLRDAVNGPFPLVRMLKLVKQRELTGYVEYFSSLLIDDPQAMKDTTVNLTLGGILHSLGTHYYERKLYEQALNHLENSLRVYLRVLPPDDIRLTPTYNNIGSIYRKQGFNEKALDYHRKAYEIQKNSANPDLDSVASYVGNIASVLTKLGQYKEAIGYFETDLKIQKKLHPNNNHPDIAVKYHNLAGAQYRAHQYADALNNYQKCLDIELKCHSADNPTVAVTYVNLATAFEKLGQVQNAKEAVEIAITRLLLTKKEDDEEIQGHRKYLQHLEQKLWMKDLFSAT